MKKTQPLDEHSKFNGRLRHYHRTGSQTQRTWDDWVKGPTVTTRKSGSWPKIVAIVGGGLALTGIIAGLIIELG